DLVTGVQTCALPISPTCSVTAPSTSGALTIDGRVQLGADPWPGLANWCIELTGTVTATMLTDGSGNYTFTGLPDGTYTVCEVVRSEERRVGRWCRGR